MSAVLIVFDGLEVVLCLKIVTVPRANQKCYVWLIWLYDEYKAGLTYFTVSLLRLLKFRYIITYIPMNAD